MERALHDRRPVRGAGLLHPSDRGVQCVSIRYTERLAQAGIELSVGSVGDSYGPKATPAGRYNALAESMIGVFRPNSSAAAARGAASRPSSLPPSSGWTGSTTDARSGRSGRSLPPRRGTMPTRRRLRWQHDSH